MPTQTSLFDAIPAHPATAPVVEQPQTPTQVGRQEQIFTRKPVVRPESAIPTPCPEAHHQSASVNPLQPEPEAPSQDKPSEPAHVATFVNEGQTAPLDKAVQTAITPREAAAIQACADVLIADTHFQNGRMIKDDTGASATTYATLLAGTLVDTTNNEFARAVAANAYVHANQLASAVDAGRLSNDQVATVLLLGKMDYEQTSSGPKKVSKIGGLSDGVEAKEGRVVGGGGLTKRLEALGFTSDDFNEHFFAGRRRLIDVGDCHAARAALSAAATGEKDPRWGAVPLHADIPLGGPGLSIGPGDWSDGTFAVSGIPKARPGHPDVATFGAAIASTKGAAHEFTPSSFKKFQEALTNHYAGQESAPFWVAATLRAETPQTASMPTVIDGPVRLATKEGTLRINVPGQWQGAGWGEVSSAIRNTSGRTFKGDNPPYWAIPDANRQELIDNLESTNTSTEAKRLHRALHHPDLGPIPEHKAPDLSGIEVAKDGTASCGDASVRLTERGLSIKIPGPWIKGWKNVKDTIKTVSNPRFDGVEKSWVITPAKAGPLADALEEEYAQTQQPYALVRLLRCDTAQSAAEADTARDEEIVGLRELRSTGVVSDDVRNRVNEASPAGLQAKDHQIFFVQTMEQEDHKVLLGDDMGLGKTLSVGFYGITHPEKWPMLIVAPANVRAKWASEMNRAGEKIGWTVGEIEGRTGGVPDTDVVISTYNVLKDHQKDLEKRGFGTLVMDECHAIKNEKSQRGKAINGIAGHLRDDAAVVGLSGTPIPNQTKELWPLIKLHRPEMFKDAKSFFRTHCITGWDETGFKPTAIWGLEDGVGLNKALYQGRTSDEAQVDRGICKPMILRRLKEDVSDLPPMTTSELPVRSPAPNEMDGRMRELAEALGQSSSKMETLTLINHERQLAGIQKVPAAIDRIGELIEEGEPVVAAAHHKKVISGLKEGLADKGITALVIDGSTPTKKRQQLANAFQDGDADVMIISQAGREGLDLTRAARFLLVEREWNPMAERQAADRIHRFGQERPCEEEKLMLEGSTDDHMKVIYDGKASLIDQVIDGIAVEEADDAKALDLVIQSIRDAYDR